MKRPVLEIREIQTEEYGFLWKMLYQAIYSPTQQLPESIVYQPSLAKYAAAFGKEGDYCFVLAADDRLVGAAWSRLLTADQKGYGGMSTSRLRKYQWRLSPLLEEKGMAEPSSSG